MTVLVSLVKLEKCLARESLMEYTETINESVDQQQRITMKFIRKKKWANNSG
jgi:hypothetical protein